MLDTQLDLVACCS